MQALIRNAMRGNGLVQLVLRASATNLSVMALGTLTSIVTARMFGAEGRGELAAILFWGTFLPGLITFGLPTSLTYNMKRHADRAGEYVRLAFAVQLPASLLAAAAAWICLPAWLAGYTPAVAETARWYALLTIPVLVTGGLLAGLAQSLERFALYNGLKLYIPLSNLLGYLALWASGVTDVRPAAFVYAATTVLVTVISLYQLRDCLRLDWRKPRFDRSAAASLFSYGSRVFGVELMGTLYNQLDKLIIISMLTPRHLGLYTVVYALSRLFNTVQNAVTNVLFPKLAALEPDRVAAAAGRAFRISTAVMLAVLAPCLALGKLLLGLLFGPEFGSAAPTFYLLALECVVGGASWILSTSFNAVGRPGLVLARQIVAMGATVGLMFVFIPGFGMEGIALAMLAGSFIRLAFSLLAMAVLFRMPVLSIVFDRSDFAYLREASRKLKTRLRSA